jgi:small subunit ribosomal protein S35
MVEFARPFRPPNKFEVLRFRYSTYFGENHPAAKKVVLNFSLKQLRKAVSEDPRFDDAWEHKLKLLLGTRYNPTSDEVRMSCELYPYPAQNKRWLSDKLDELVETAAVCLQLLNAN